MNIFFAEYRGYGDSTGTPQLVAMLDDTGPLIDALGLPPSRVVVYGRSIGSIYAIEAVEQRPDVAGLVLESGIADPLERVLMRVRPEELGAKLSELESEAARRLDHRDKLARYGGAVLVLHARHDHLVDLSNGERLARWAGQEAKLVIFDRGDHNSILAHNARAILAKVQALCARVVPR